MSDPCDAVDICTMTSSVGDCANLAMLSISLSPASKAFSAAGLSIATNAQSLSIDVATNFPNKTSDVGTVAAMSFFDAIAGRTVL